MTLAVAAAACSAPDAADRTRGRDASRPAAVEIRDAAGRTVRFQAPARRVVSLVPSATRTLHALGMDSVLVGRTDYDDAPWARDVPSVGGGLAPDLETIRSLDPDLVIHFGGAQDPRTPARLDRLGIPRLAIRPERIEDVLHSIELVGAAVGVPQRARELTAHIRASLDSLRGRVEGLPPVRAAYVLGGTPPWVAGPGNYIHEILTVAGAVNVFEDLSTPWGSVSPEEFRIRAIDVVVTSDAATVPPDLVPGARVVAVGDALNMPGPELAEAAWRVAELIHGVPLR